MNDTDPFPNDIEREIIKLFLCKEEASHPFPIMRVGIAIRRDGSWVLMENDLSRPRVTVPLPIVSLWSDGVLRMFAPFFTTMESCHAKSLQFIFEELGDPRAHQPLETWFPRSNKSLQPICGPMTLLAYRAAQWTSRHYRSEKQP